MKMTLTMYSFTSWIPNIRRKKLLFMIRLAKFARLFDRRSLTQQEMGKINSNENQALEKPPICLFIELSVCILPCLNPNVESNERGKCKHLLIEIFLKCLDCNSWWLLAVWLLVPIYFIESFMFLMNRLCSMPNSQNEYTKEKWRKKKMLKRSNSDNDERVSFNCLYSKL